MSAQIETQTPIEKIQSQFVNLKQKQFTGKMDIRVSTGQTWSLYFNLGRLVWATGGAHEARRWRRCLGEYYPQINWEAISCKGTDDFSCWDYHLLAVLAKRKLVTLEKAGQVITNVAIEIFFDIFQKLETKPHSQKTFAEICQIKYYLGERPSNDLMLPPSCIVPIEQLIQKAQHNWQIWVKAGLRNCSPNLAPILKKPALLKQQTPDHVYTNLVKLIQGKHTLRELAFLLKQDLLKLVRLLLPYLQKNLIGLKNIPDLAQPRLQQVEESTLQLSELPNAKTNKKGVIACIDDSPRACLLMQSLLQEQGFISLSIQDELQALPMLIQHKPDLIFLDLMMPIASGYEICTQLRRISQFKETPIVILTAQDGIVDRMRTKMVGATDFLSKPIDPNKLKTILQKYKLLAKENIPQVTQVNRLGANVLSFSS